MGLPLHAKVLGLLNVLEAKLKITNSENLQHFDSDPLKYLILITYSLL